MIFLTSICCSLRSLYGAIHNPQKNTRHMTHEWKESHFYKVSTDFNWPYFLLKTPIKNQEIKKLDP